MENLEQEARDFLSKVVKRLGIGCETCMPLAVHEIPPNGSLKPTQEQIEKVLFTIVKDVSKHNVNPKSIDILVSNCSLFCPTPSITATIMNKFGFESPQELNCIGSQHGSCYAQWLPWESQVHAFSQRSLSYGRSGCSIINKKHNKGKAKYKLQHLVQTHMGSKGQSYQSVFQEPDEEGHVGVSLSKTLLRVWQIAFGSGFKCDSAVWKCISKLDPKARNAWSDCIHLYPVEVPDVSHH